MSIDPGPYDLGVCRLRPLAAGEADVLGHWLPTIDPFKTLGFSAQALTRYLRRPDPALTRFAVDHQGRLAGVLALRHPWLAGAYIETLALAEEVRGAGIGRALIAFAAGQSDANLWACVSAFNTDARRFYAANGFTEVVELADLVRDGFGEILLRKR